MYNYINLHLYIHITYIYIYIYIYIYQNYIHFLFFDLKSGVVLFLIFSDKNAQIMIIDAVLMFLLLEEVKKFWI